MHDQMNGLALYLCDLLKPSQSLIAVWSSHCPVGASLAYPTSQLLINAGQFSIAAALRSPLSQIDSKPTC